MRSPLAPPRDLPAPRRILAIAQPLSLGGIKHALDPATKAGSGFRLLVPKRLERSGDGWPTGPAPTRCLA
jgi:hypothetical protein